ncbi:MAG: MBL fold metallo-hydrolase [Thermoleophilia bacterium]|nr:MBL fold metallo-hydrolase [Thermoleophilia bacterium]
MIIERTEHPGWLSNAYLLADRDGGHGVLVDSNGVNEPLLAAAERLSLTITHVLVTHHHEDHVVTCAADAARFGVPVLGHPLAREAGVPLDGTIGDGDVVRSGGLELRVIETPGHCRDHLALLAGEDCLTGDCLFAGTVGGTAGGGPTGYADQVRSIMERLLALPPQTRLHPGHAGPTTVAAEWESNPFVRVWRGLDPEGTEPCRVAGEEATLVLWGPDYDGTHKAWVRYPDGRDQIVGGSRVERL